jgi:D-sedoheptulose 7-phosphate isomerase
MSDWLHKQLAEHVRVAEATASLAEQVRSVGMLLCRTFADGGAVYTLGNGGSAADAQHLTGEFIGHYKRDRRPLPSVSLCTDPSVFSCIANDYSYAEVFSRQIEALVRTKDAVVAFSTSGRSANVVSALAVARTRGATTVLFGAGDGGPARAHADHALLVASTVTARIQEMHTLMLHIISEMVDEWAAGAEPAA